MVGASSLASHHNFFEKILWRLFANRLLISKHFLCSVIVFITFLLIVVISRSPLTLVRAEIVAGSQSVTSSFFFFDVLRPVLWHVVII